MNYMKNLSIKASISLLVAFTVFIFLGIVLYGFNQVSTKVADGLGESQHVIESLNDEMEQMITNNLAQLSEQVNSGFSIFLNKMKEIASTVESDSILEPLIEHESIPNGPYEGTPYAILPPHNKHELNEVFTPYFANLVRGIEEVQFAYIGTPDKAMYIGPLDDFDFTAFDPTSRPWYQDAVARPDDYIWTDPYIDAITGQPVMTLAKAVRAQHADQRFIGVVGLDFSLQTLASNVNTVKFGEHGYAFLLDASGVLMTHPYWEDRIGESMLDYDFLQDVYGADEGILRYTLDEQAMIGYFVTNEITGWKLVITAPEQELLGIQDVIRQVEVQNESILSGLNDSERSIMLLFLGIGVLLIVLGIWIAHVYSRSMNRRIQFVNDAMDNVSKGDLTQTIDVGSEQNEISALSRNFNTMVGDLKQLVQSNLSISAQISQASQTLQDMSRRSADGAENIQHIVNEISTYLEKQAQSSMETGKVIESFTAEMEQVMQAIGQVDQTVQQSYEVSRKGSSSIGQLEEATAKNLELTKTVTANVRELSEQMNAIYSFSTIIQEIAANTNLLALNASIEASRAGDEGRGFAVVAMEVRKLAEQSAQSAKDIADRIQHIQTHFDETVNNIVQTEQMAHQQHEVLTFSKEGFDRIQASIDNIRSRMEATGGFIEDMRMKTEVLVDSIQQSIEDSEQASTYVMSIHHTLDEQFQAIKEVSSSTDELTNITETLNRESRKFKTESSR